MVDPFQDIIGQEKSVAYLKQNIASGTLPHALLFYDRDGGEGLPLAIATAKALLAQGREEDEKPAVYARVGTLSHPDLLLLYPVVKKDKLDTSEDYLPLFRELFAKEPRMTYKEWGDALSLQNTQLSISVKEAEYIEEKLSFRPYEADYRVVLCWLPEKMNISCANKLLKLLEEPPKGVHFIFVSTAPELLLPTIISRVQRIPVHPIMPDVMSRFLVEQYGIAEDAAARIAHLSSGSIVTAKMLLESGEKTAEETLRAYKILTASMRGSTKEMKKEAEELHTESREYLTALCKELANVVREAFIFHMVSDKQQQATLLYSRKESLGVVRQLSLVISEKNVERVSEAIDVARKELMQNVSAKMVFFDLMLQLWKFFSQK
ncbi:MAG: hypothetical protein Q3998_03635 [Porphyromonas sp.]|nr:hypothetical protein [Porphyromonas sp.]